MAAIRFSDLSHIRYLTSFRDFDLIETYESNYTITFLGHNNRTRIAGILCQEDASQKICEDKSSGEMFRLKAGKENCRDVVQCTAAVSFTSSAACCRETKNQHFLIVFTCAGLATNQMSPGSRI